MVKRRELFDAVSSAVDNNADVVMEWGAGDAENPVLQSGGECTPHILYQKT